MKFSVVACRIHKFMSTRKNAIVEYLDYQALLS